MAQPQYQQAVQPPASPFSPPQSTTSTSTSPQFPLPPNKRQRLSPGAPSQPTSPYSQSPYSMSPGSATSTSSNPSPHFPNISIPPNVYNTPYGNKAATPVTTQTHQPANPLAPNLPPASGYQQSAMTPTSSAQPAPRFQAPAQPGGVYQQTAGGASTPQPLGVMGPPQKPPEKITKEDESVEGAFDVLAGSGIDLRAEENFTLSFAFEPKAAVTSSPQSFSQFSPGSQDNFYGAGPASQSGETIVEGKSQDDVAKEAADKLWHAAAYKIARARDSEVRNPRVLIAPLWKKMESIATEHGLELLIDKSSGKMGDFIKPQDYLDKERGLDMNAHISVQTVLGPDGGMMTTSGRFLPDKSPLIDQLALVSLATNQQLKGMVADAARIARGRQNGSHGIIPEEWVDAAEASNGANGTIVPEDSPRFGWETAVSPLTDPTKRAPPTPKSEKPSPQAPPTFTNDLVAALRSAAKTERNQEEARLLKRQNRGNPEARAASNVPGTPGSMIIDSEKAPTKKEQKNQAKAKLSEAETHMNANKTTKTFLGGGGAMFGKKRKTYSWMTSGDGGGSGASTPGRLATPGLPGTAGGSIASQTLTQDGANRLGSWREDREKGQGIQLRDWVAVLENIGREVKSLQMAYSLLDKSAR